MFFCDVFPKKLAVSWNASVQPLVNEARAYPWLYNSYEPQNVRIEWELTEYYMFRVFWWCPPKNAYGELERQRTASRKWGLCFPLSIRFLWAPKRKKRVGTHWNITCFVFFGDASPKMLVASWNAGVQPLVNEARVSPYLDDSYEP